MSLIRERIISRLEKEDCPITWISAPSGFGKSVLLSQISCQHTGAILRFSLNPRHQDPGVFFADFIRVLLQDHDFKNLPIFDQSHAPFIQEYTQQLFTEIQSQLDGNTLIVFDDFQCLENTPQILSAMDSVLPRFLQSINFVIASHLPPLSSFPRLMAAGNIVQVEQEEMLMNEQDISDLVQLQGYTQLSPDELLVSNLFQATGGWPIGIGLLLEVYKSKSDITLPPLNESREIIFSNYSASFFQDFSVEEQKILLEIPPTSELRSDILLLVSGTPTVEMLDRLCQNNLMVSKYYTGILKDKAVYRLHSLFASFLKHRRLSIPSKTSIKRKGEAGSLALKYCEQLFAVGEEDAAQELLIELEHWDRIFDYARENAEKFFQSGRSLAFLRLFNSIPESKWKNDVELSFWHALCMRQANLFKSHAELISVYPKIKETGSEKLLIFAWTAVISSYWFMWDQLPELSPLIDDLPLIKKAAERINDPVVNDMLIKGAFMALSSHCSEHPDLEYWEQKNLALFLEEKWDGQNIERGLQLVCYYIYDAGDRHKAEIVLQQVSRIFESDASNPSYLMVVHVMSAAYQFWFEEDGRIAPATVIAGLIVSKSLDREYFDIPMINAALFRLAADEDRDGMSMMIKLLDERGKLDQRLNNLAIIRHFAAYSSWLDGDHEKAFLHIRSAYEISISSGFSASPGYYSVGYARVLHSVGQRRKAWQILHQCRVRARAKKSDVMMFMALLASAAILIEEGQETRASKYLQPALEIGEKQTYQTALWIGKETLKRLSELAIKRNFGVVYARQLVKEPQTHAVTQSSAKIEVRTLGLVDILIDGRSQLTSRKPQMMPLLILLHLVASGTDGIHLNDLFDDIWPRMELETNRNRLKPTLHKLRKLMGNGNAVILRNGILRLNPDLVEVDSWQVEALCQEKNGDPDLAEKIMNAHPRPFFNFRRPDKALLRYRSELNENVSNKITRIAETLIDDNNVDDVYIVLRKMQAYMQVFGSQASQFDNLILDRMLNYPFPSSQFTPLAQK